MRTTVMEVVTEGMAADCQETRNYVGRAASYEAKDAGRSDGGDAIA
jgi:hypothetical protein